MADIEKRIIVSVDADTSQAASNLEELKQKLQSIDSLNVGGDSIATLKDQIKLAAQEAANMRDAFGENSQEFQVAAEYLVKLRNTAVDSVGTIKSQLKEANIQAQLMANLYGEGSQEFKRAAKEVANLKDKFQEYHASVDSFNPDNKLQSLVSVAQGATGAIQGVTGAMAFLGVESEDANETLVKLQGLMNFSQALNSVDDIKNGFKNLTSVLGLTTKATQGTTTATRIFGTAFKAIGIGLIVSAIAYLVSNWDSLRTSITKTIPALNNIGGVFNKVKQIAFGVGNALLQFVITPIKSLYQVVTGDFEGAMKTIKDGVSFKGNFEVGKQKEVNNQIRKLEDEKLGNTIKSREREIDILKASGKDTYAIERRNIQDKLKLAKEGSEEYEELKHKDALLEANHNKKMSDVRQKASEKAVSDRRAAQEKINKENKEAEDKYQQHVDKVKGIIEGADKEIALSKLNDREKELFKLQDDFSKREKEIKSTYAKSAELEKEAIEKLALEKSIKEKDVTEKYNKIIGDFINGYEQTQYEKSRAKLVEDFDEKIKIADEKQKVLLEKLKTDELASLDTKETLRKETINKETTLVDVQTDNKISDEDTPEQRVEKLQAVYDAEQEFKRAKFNQQLETLAGDEQAIALLKAQYRQQEQNAEQAHTDAKIAIAEQEKQARLNVYKGIGDAAGALGNLFGKQTVANKALNVANALMNTYTGITEIWRAKSVLPEPMGTVAKVASTVVAATSGFSAVKNILSTKVPGGGGEAAVSAPQLTAPALSVTQVNQDLNKIQDVRVTNDNQVVRAYISDRDLQENEDKNAFLKKLGNI